MLCFSPGIIDVFVGGQQPNQATSIESNVLHAPILVQNDEDLFMDELWK